MTFVIATVICLLGSALASAAMAPPPRIKGQPVSAVPAGTPAPDGVGVATWQTSTVGVYGGDDMTYAPWENVNEVKPIAVGARIPAGSVVRTASNEPFDLAAAVARQPTVLIFYRGGWCPFCNAHLRELQKSVGALQSLGYQLLAVSADEPQEMSRFTADPPLTYQLLSDSQLEVAGRFGIRFKVSKQYLDHIKTLPNDHDVDMLARNGGYLLTPGVFIFDTRGTLRYSYVNNNYTVRIRQEKLLEAARAALQ